MVSKGFGPSIKRANCLSEMQNNWLGDTFHCRPKRLSVLSNAASDTVWVHMRDEVWVYDGDQFYTAEFQCEDWLAVDYAGRLLCVNDGELVRQSLYRPVGFSGLPREPLYRSFELALDPTHGDQIDTVDLRLNGIPIRLDGPPWKTVVQPSEWGQGSFSLTADVHYTDGQRFATQVDRTINLGLPLWDSDIQPLYELHCSMCHSGSTYTLLDEKEFGLMGST